MDDSSPQQSSSPETLKSPEQPPSESNSVLYGFADSFLIAVPFQTIVAGLTRKQYVSFHELPLYDGLNQGEVPKNQRRESTKLHDIIPVLHEKVPWDGDDDDFSPRAVPRPTSVADERPSRLVPRKGDYTPNGKVLMQYQSQPSLFSPNTSNTPIWPVSTAYVSLYTADKCYIEGLAKCLKMEMLVLV
ncbi:hypothetical protein AYL99_11990 [Fonsecaea erecta]|uniref:Uncharacterized protein n=1 Tax=Fonsecaea erecta TaxID=1367422 RepID=A0A178Z282_9EURO|nr:hypothetical protein AYL99_11990 [Fonsecaea erecta]OAP53804.1 hypothetical protein AYL99_11990 [Fonsecaea erecta]